ncbi:MAG: hypothetical protein LBU60_05145 [Clostridiales bacterium]|jgi:hypothetical protein|nr:hypothetical protein [Clostridiales bacterium]
MSVKVKDKVVVLDAYQCRYCRQTHVIKLKDNVCLKCELAYHKKVYGLLSGGR